jgi:hypothetical protein
MSFSTFLTASYRTTIALLVHHGPPVYGDVDDKGRMELPVDVELGMRRGGGARQQDRKSREERAEYEKKSRLCHASHVKLYNKLGHPLQEEPE